MIQVGEHNNKNGGGGGKRQRDYLSCFLRKGSSVRHDSSSLERLSTIGKETPRGACTVMRHLRPKK